MFHCFNAETISRGSKAIDELRGEIKRNINVLLLQMSDSAQAQAVLEQGVWSYITKDNRYEWRFYLVGGSITVSCRRNYGDWLFSNRDKDQLIPIGEVVNVHMTMEELNEAAMKKFGGMRIHLTIFAQAASYNRV
mgnify:FL=1